MKHAFRDLFDSCFTIEFKKALELALLFYLQQVANEPPMTSFDTETDFKPIIISIFLFFYLLYTFCLPLVLSSQVTYKNGLKNCTGATSATSSQCTAVPAAIADFKNEGPGVKLSSSIFHYRENEWRETKESYKWRYVQSQVTPLDIW